MTHRFKLIKGREEFDLDPKLFNHIDGRRIIAFVKDPRYFQACYCISRSGHCWREDHYENRDDALEHFKKSMFWKADVSWTVLINPERAFATRLA